MEDNNNEKKGKAVVVWKKIGMISLRILSYISNAILTLMIIGMITALIVGTVFAIYIKNELDLEIDTSLFVTKGQNTTTTINYMKYETEEDRMTRNGTPVEIEEERLYGSVNSIWADYDSMPDYLIKAFISIEDHRFMNPDNPEEGGHNGVDFKGTAKAVLNYFLRFEDVRGASTITQQLVKNLTGDDEVTIQRKVEEIFRSIDLEKRLSKQEILEMYLNIVYLGNNCYGVQAAANTYFGKDVSELNLEECAALASIVKNPSRYEPLYHNEFSYTDENGEEQFDGNKYRRQVVLQEMYHYGYLTLEQCNEAKEKELNITYFDDSEENTVNTNTIHSWYVDAVITQIIEDLMEQNNWTYAVASRKLYTSGYSIYIPMDPEVQDIMEAAYEDEVSLFDNWEGGMLPESAMVITDPYTGDVLGLVGGTGVKSGNLLLNRATGAKRPVGSSIKPISVYGLAMDLGLITSDSKYIDGPVMINKTVHGEGTDWEWVEEVPYPKNTPAVYETDPIDIKYALQVSKNTVAMKVLQELGVDKSFDFLKNTLHMDSLVESYTKGNGETVTDKGLAALSLGQLNYGCTVLEMASAYSIFPNNGLYESGNLYLYVKDSSGNIVLENKHYTEVALKESTAQEMTKLLQNVCSNGTGAAVQLRYQVETAGKTGTTNADFDRYFVGYTPYCVGAVWVGYDINSSLSAFNYNPACKIWDKIMTQVHQKYIDDANSGGTPLETFFDE